MGGGNITSTARVARLREFAGPAPSDATLRRLLVRAAGDTNHAAALLLSDPDFARAPMHDHALNKQNVQEQQAEPSTAVPSRLSKHDHVLDAHRSPETEKSSPDPAQGNEKQIANHTHPQPPVPSRNIASEHRTALPAQPKPLPHHDGHVATTAEKRPRTTNVEGAVTKPNKKTRGNTFDTKVRKAAWRKFYKSNYAQAAQHCGRDNRDAIIAHIASLWKAKRADRFQLFEEARKELQAQAEADEVQTVMDEKVECQVEDPSTEPNVRSDSTVKTSPVTPSKDVDKQTATSDRDAGEPHVDRQSVTATDAHDDAGETDRRCEVSSPKAATGSRQNGSHTTADIAGVTQPPENLHHDPDSIQALEKSTINASVARSDRGSSDDSARNDIETRHNDKVDHGNSAENNDPAGTNHNSGQSDKDGHDNGIEHHGEALEKKVIGEALRTSGCKPDASVAAPSTECPDIDRNEIATLSPVNKCAKHDTPLQTADGLGLSNVEEIVDSGSGTVSEAPWPKQFASRIVMGSMLTSGKDLLKAGQLVQLEVPVPRTLPPHSRMRSGKRSGNTPGSAKKASSRLPFTKASGQPAIVRFSRNGRELGRIEADFAQVLAPAIHGGHVLAVTRVVEAPRMSRIMSAVYLDISVSLKSSAFDEREQEGRAIDSGWKTDKESKAREGDDAGDDGDGLDNGRLAVINLMGYLDACNTSTPTARDSVPMTEASPDSIDEDGKVSENQTETYYRTVRKIEDDMPDFQHPAPLRAELRDYQKLGVAWMQAREKYGNVREGVTDAMLHPLWKRKFFPDGTEFFVNGTTGAMTLTAPRATAEGPYGGILADEMGLGKTVQCIGLIVAEKYSRIQGESESRPVSAAGSETLVVDCDEVLDVEQDERIAGTSSKRELALGSGAAGGSRLGPEVAEDVDSDAMRAGDEAVAEPVSGNALEQRGSAERPTRCADRARTRNLRRDRGESADGFRESASDAEPDGTVGTVPLDRRRSDRVRKKVVYAESSDASDGSEADGTDTHVQALHHRSQVNDRKLKHRRASRDEDTENTWPDAHSDHDMRDTDDDDFRPEEASQWTCSAKRKRPALPRGSPPQKRPRAAILGEGRATSAGKPCGATLLVVPMSMIQQWLDELALHVRPGFLRCVSHYGPQRALTAREISSERADVVITSYGTLASEFGNEEPEAKFASEGPLLQLEWDRVILDEAHNIKGRITKWAHACFAVKAQRRWCVTGTPIQNHINDVYSLLHFLRVEPWSAWSFWQKGILGKLESKDSKSKLAAMSTVRDILSPLTLRRLKVTKNSEGLPLVQLTKRTIEVVRLEQSAMELDFYEALHRKSRAQFDTYVAQGKVLNNYGSVLELLLRLRQACDHPYLVFAASQSDSAALKDRSKMLAAFASAGSSQFVDTVLSQAETGALSDCPVCLDVMDDAAALKKCGHSACRACLLQLLHHGASGSVCPVCRTPIDGKEDIATLPRHNGSRFPMDVRKQWKSSAKIDALMNDVREMNTRRSDANAPVGKTVIMSQFTSFLDLLETALERDGHRYLRFDGTMSQRARAQVLHAFATDNEMAKVTANVLLVSLKSGGVGLNLVSASRLCLADPSWNPQVDMQAMARVHRHGQKREVTIKRYVITNSVEERLLEVQQRKVDLSEGALDSASEHDKQQARLSEIKMLFSR